MRSRIEVWANWLYEHWRLIFIPPLMIIGFLFLAYSEYTADPDLTDRARRGAIFIALQSEINGLEIPTRSAINHSEGMHKRSSILVSSRYRTEAKPSDFFREMDGNLRQRGWVAYAGSEDNSAVRTFHYCRGKQDANLYLEGKSIFNSDTGNYWKLILSVGLRSRPGLFGQGTFPVECPDR